MTRSQIKQLEETLLVSKPKTVFLTGDYTVYRSSLRCAASIARKRRVVYLDGANTFDPYEIAHYAERRGLCAETLLKTVFIRRAFTCYQMYEMVVRVPIDRIMASQAVLVISGPCATFFDESVTQTRAAWLFYRMMYRLEYLSHVHLPMIIVQPNECRQTPRRYFLAELRRVGDIKLVIGAEPERKSQEPNAVASERGRIRQGVLF